MTSSYIVQEINIPVVIFFFFVVGSDIHTILSHKCDSSPQVFSPEGGLREAGVSGQVLCLSRLRSW